MYCRNCGTLLDDKTEICVKCGCKPEKGTKYCPKCGIRTREKQAVCEACGYGLDRESFFDSYNVDFSTPLRGKTLKKYYQKEFQKIHNSKGAYKGKFNICAFLFAPIWSMANPYGWYWIGGLIIFLLSIGSLGSLYIIDGIYLGFRGTYKYYKSYVFFKTLDAWEEITDSKN